MRQLAPTAVGHAMRCSLILVKYPHPVSPWPRRDAAAPRLPVAPGKSRSARLLANDASRRWISYPFLYPLSFILYPLSFGPHARESDRDYHTLDFDFVLAREAVPSTAD
jgi:hypothetical protein